MKTPLLFTVTLLFLLSFNLEAQREETLLGDLDLTGLWGGATYNYSALGNDGAYVRGGFGGVELGNRVFLGYGGWRIKDDVRVEDTGERFDFRHGGFVLAYSHNTYRSIHPRATMIFGPGRVSVNGERDRVFVAQPMAGLELNVFQVFRLGVDAGYRYVGNVAVENSVIASEDVSSFILQIEMRFGFSW